MTNIPNSEDLDGVFGPNLLMSVRAGGRIDAGADKQADASATQ